MAKKMVCRVVASRAERPRTDSSFFWNFFKITISLRNAYFPREKLGSLERKLPVLGIGIV
jgi:hypothetical protein